MPQWNVAGLIRLLNGHYIRLPANLGARVHRLGSDQSHNNTGNWVKVEFDTERVDTGITLTYTNGMWDVANATRLTAVKAGWHSIWGGIAFDQSAGGTRRLVGILLNNTSFISVGGVHTPLASVPTYTQASTLWWMDVGDYVELSGLQDSGGNLDMLGKSGGDFSCEFAMVRIP